MIPIALVEDRYSGVVKTWQADWEKLSRRLARCDIGEKDGRGWMPADIEPGPRTAERVKSVSLLVLDVEAEAENIDGEKKIIGPEPPVSDAMSAEIGLWGWRCILHTSFNHAADNPRYRLTFDLSRPLTPEELKPLGLHVADLLGIGDCVDTGCLEAARLFYLPRCPADRQTLFYHADIPGVALPVDELIADAARINEAKKSAAATRRTGQSAGVIEAFNNAHDVGAILEQHGYRLHGRGRWLWPGSTTGLAGVRLLPDAVPQRVYSSHGGDPLNDGHARDAFDLWRILRHGGDMSAAVKDAARICGMATHTTGNAPGTVLGVWPAPLAEEAYHGLAGKIVREIEPETESDPAAIFMQVLVAFGALVGRGPHYAVEGDQHHANLFALIVGDTAKARKGTSWGRVRELFSMVENWPNVVNGLATGEGLKWAVRDPMKKVQRDEKTGFSSEIETDPGVSDKRLLVVEAEFSQVLKQGVRPGNTLSPTLRSAWDGQKLSGLTKSDAVTATGAHICIIGHITANELRAELTATDSANGFANRFLFMCARRSKKLAFGGKKLSPEAGARLVKEIAQAAGKARVQQSIEMTPAARETWAGVYAVLSEGCSGLLGAVTARAEAQCIRLALLFALMDEAKAIDKAHLLAAIALWERTEASARHIFGAAIGDQVADDILRALKVAGTSGMTRTAISKTFSGHKTSERIGAALELLHKRGLVRFETRQTNGAPAEIWVAQ